MGMLSSELASLSLAGWIGLVADVVTIGAVVGVIRALLQERDRKRKMAADEIRSGCVRFLDAGSCRESG